MKTIGDVEQLVQKIQWFQSYYEIRAGKKATHLWLTQKCRDVIFEFASPHLLFRNIYHPNEEEFSGMKIIVDDGVDGFYVGRLDDGDIK